MEFKDLAVRLREMLGTTFGIGISTSEVEAAEEVLQVRFGSGYSSFLEHFGWAEIGSVELFGLGKDIPPYLNVVELTQRERTEMQPHLPLHLVPLMNDGMGNLFCLQSTKGMQEDCPIVYWDHEAGEDQVPEEVAPTFADWLWLMIDEEARPYE